MRFPMFVVVAALGLAVPGSAHATWPGVNGRLVMTERTHDSARLAVGDLGGGVTRHDWLACGYEMEATWSPDGRSVLYAGQSSCPTAESPYPPNDIWLTDRDFTQRRRMTTGGAGTPTWAPDGRRFAYGARDGIWVMNRDGTGAVRISPPGQEVQTAPDMWPAWSPDGRRIAFIVRGGAGVRHVFSMNADGSDRRLLASCIAESGSDLSAAERASWSPDGRRILYGCHLLLGSTVDLWTMDANGGDKRRLTDTPNIHERDAKWSPDGKMIAYGDIAGVGIMQADGTGHRILHPGFSQPDWEPVAPPPPPTGLRVIRAIDGAVELDWDDSPLLRGGDSYQVYVNDRLVARDVRDSRHTVTGLTNRVTYGFRVSAGQPGSYGEWSATPATATPTGSLGPRPGIPSGLRVAAEGDGRIELDWADSPDLRSGDSYQVYVDGRAVNLSVAGSRYVLEGLENGRAYALRVSAGQPASYGEWTAPVSGTPRAPRAAGGLDESGGGTPPTSPPVNGGDGGAGAPSGRPVTDGGGARPPGSGPENGRGRAEVGLRVLGPTRLRPVAATGVRVRATCTSPCSVTARLMISRKTARTLGSTTRLARTARRIPAGGSAIVRLRPPARVVRRLLRMSRLDATIVLEAVDGEGVVRRMRRSVTFLR